MADLYGKLSSVGKLTGSISLTEDRILKGFLTVPEDNGALIPEYDGPYEVTPTTSTQTFLTNGSRMIDNVVVKPIPSNYGLITWNGNTLTVS